MLSSPARTFLAIWETPSPFSSSSTRIFPQEKLIGFPFLWRRPLRVLCAAQAAEELAPDREVPVAEGVAHRGRAGSPRATAQNLVTGPEEDLGVLLVGEGFEARVGAEVAGGPLPDVPDKPQDPVGARPFGVRPDLRRPESELIEVGVCGRGGIVAPRIKPLGPRIGVPRGRFLPLLFRREALAGPPGVRIGLVPRDVHYRRVGVEGLVEAEPLRPPAVRLGLVPVLGGGYALPLYVLPALIVPELRPLVTPAFDELREGLVCDRGLVDEEAWEVHDVRVPFVIQGMDAVVGAHDERAGGGGDRLFLDPSAGRKLDPSPRLVALAGHELEGLEHGLVVLALVLDDHVVDEAVFQERVVPIKVGRFEGFEDRFGHGVKVAVGLSPVEQVQGWALLAGVH